MSKPRLVLIGNGMAGVRTVEELLKIKPDHYDITIFGAEPHPNYNRILLSPVLAGEMTIQEIVLNELDWYQEKGIKLHTGKQVASIDRVKRKVIADDGTEESYDRLLIATGSNPFVLPIPGNDLPGVIGYRDIKDTDEMIAAARLHRHAVVIGGGLLGLEAANGLKLRGMDVTVVHAAEWLLERQLDEVAGKMLQKSLEDRGLKFLMQKQTEALIQGESGRVAAIRFKDGMQIPADLVVMAVGIRPNYALAEASGIYCNRGIVVNDTMQTFDPKVYAVGECVSHRGIAYGLVAPLFEQAKVAANHLAGYGIGRYTGSVTSTKLKVTGIDLFSAGNFLGGKDTEEIVLNDPAGGVYKKLVIRDNKLVGGVMFGDTADGPWYFQLLKDGRDIHDIRDHLIFGQSLVGDVGHAGNSKAAVDGGQRRGLRLQRREQGHDHQNHQGTRLVHAGRGQEAHQGGLVLRFLRRSGRADPRLDHRRRLHAGRFRQEAGLRLYRAVAPDGARGHPRPAPDQQGSRLQGAGMENAERLRQVPAGGELLPDFDLAA